MRKLPYKVNNKMAGFTLIEVMATLVLLGLVTALSVQHFMPVDSFSTESAGSLTGTLGSIQGAYNAYVNDKNQLPAFGSNNNALEDSSFVPVYLFIPRPPSGFDSSYGVSGFQLGQRSGQDTPNNGVYICAKAPSVTATSVPYRAIVKSAAALSANKFFYNDSCPATSSFTSDPSSASDVYVTCWIVRN